MDDNKELQEFTPIPDDDIISILNDMEDDEMRVSKFYNFHCITLYGYVDNNMACSMVGNAELGKQNQPLINTPIELYESPYMARLLTPKAGQKELIAFAIEVENNIYDELDLSLENQVKKDGRNPKEIQRSVCVVRQLKQYKQNNKKKCYISYTINDQKAIKAVIPLFN